MQIVNTKSGKVREDRAQAVKTVGKRGQFCLGKTLAGVAFILEELPNGDLLLKRAVPLQEHERWLHTPQMRKKLAKADAWRRRHPPRETNLEALEAKLLGRR